MRSLLPASASALSATLCLLVAATGADWPQWQGPERNSISKETGLLQEWPQGGPALAWKNAALGGGYCAPAIAGGMIFGMSNRGGEEVVWALAEKDGAEIWVEPLGPAYAGGMRQGIEGAGCTPTVDGDHLYVLGFGGDLACLRVTDGEIVWRRNLITDFGGRLPTWRYNESPLVDGDAVVCTPGGEEFTMVALNKLSGEVIWKSKAPGAATPGSATGGAPPRRVTPPPSAARRGAPEDRPAADPPSPPTAPADFKPTVLVAEGSKWKYFDAGATPDAEWMKLEFKDDAWSAGEAQLGYGDRDEKTLISNAADGYPTYYFRQKFEVADPSDLKPLVLRVLRDDGAIVYLNGKEVVRDNMPEGAVNHGTFAAAVTPSENGFYVHDLAPDTLVAGTNLLAVEVHQASADSSDVSFDLELREKIQGKDTVGAPPSDRRGRTFGGRGSGGAGAGRSGAGYSSAIAIDFGGQRQYVQFTSSALIGVAASDGRQLWSYEKPANRMGINCSTPLFLDGHVFAASAYGSGGGMAKLSVDESGGMKAAEVWFSSDMENHHGGMLVVDGCIYGANGGNGGGQLACLDAKTGELLWQDRARDGRRAEKGSVAAADGRIYYRTEEGDVLLIEPSRSEYLQRGRLVQPDRTRQPAWTHPVIANGRLYIRDQETLYCYDVSAK